MGKFKETIEHWRRKQKLSFSDDGTFVEKWSVKISVINIITLVFLFTIIISIAIYLIFLYTPLKKVLFEDISLYEVNEKLIQNSETLDLFEKELKAQEEYSNTLKKILNGESIKDTTLERNIDTLEGIIQVDFSSNKADSLMRYKIESKPIKKNETKNPELIDFFVAPVKGTISRSLNREEKHYGVDIVTKNNEPIKATLNGRIIFSGWTNRQGNTIIIQHNNQLITSYKHCSALLKKEGEFVEAGDPIGIVGNTGELTDGPHLHFEIWQNGIALNPQEFINF